jgi:hypothetical protein
MKYIKSRYQNPLGAKAFWQGHHWYDMGGDLAPGLTMAYNGTNLPESILTNGITRRVIKALENATLSYAGFKNIAKNNTLVPIGGQPGIDGEASHTYNYNVAIDAAGMSPQELKRTISEVIDSKHILHQKKVGAIK